MSDALLSVPFWRDQPEPWDTLVLAGQAWPGVADVRIRRSRTLEKKGGGNGTVGEVITPKGAKAASGTITLRIRNAEELAELERKLPEIDPQDDDGRPVAALDIEHPKARLRRVRSIIVEHVDGPDPAPANTYELKISWTEFKKTGETQGTAAIGGSKGKPGTSCDALHAQEADLNARRRAATTPDEILALEPEYEALAEQMAITGCGVDNPNMDPLAGQPSEIDAV